MNKQDFDGERPCANMKDTAWSLSSIAGERQGWGHLVGPHFHDLLCHVNDLDPHYGHDQWAATGIWRWRVGSTNVGFKVGGISGGNI